MRNKAISTVIASILMLMIVIALGGTTYLYISGIFTGKTTAAFEIIDAVNDTVIIRNSGTDPITSITSSLDGNVANIAVVPNIQGLVAYWSFNEGSGTTTDDNSQNNNVGTLKPLCPNCPSWTDGKYGKALRFDGSDDYVSVPDSNSLDVQTFTVSAWFTMPNDLSEWAAIYEKGTELVVFPRYTTNILYLLLNGGYYSTGGVLNPNVWYNYAVTFDCSTRTISFYLDGIPKGITTSTSGCPDITTDAVNIGRYGTSYFNGAIDEVIIYNRVLSESEIKALYNSGLVVSPGQLATIKVLSSLSKGTHTLRLCTSSMCNTALLAIS